MSSYLTAFSGRFTKEAVAGLFWTPENSRQTPSPLEILRRDDPWLAPLAQGPRVFTLSEPDDPQGIGLGEPTAGELPLSGGKRGVVQLLETLLLKALAAAGERVDLQERFVAFGSRSLPGSRLAIDGVKLQLHPFQDGWTLWMHPLRRVIDARPLFEAIADRKGRPTTFWFAQDGISYEGLFPKPSDKGIQIQMGRHARLLSPTAPVFLLLGEEQPDLEPRQLIENARRWVACPSVTEAGFEFATSPLALEEVGYEAVELSEPDAWVLDSGDNRVALGEHYRKALNGSLSVRDSSVPATFHFVDAKDEEMAEELALFLNQKASTWGARFQFATEPLPGSFPISLGGGSRTAIHIDPGSPLLTQPQSSRALGQIGAIFLECVRVAGGIPWRLGGPVLRPTLGLSHALLHGRQHHVAAALFDEQGVAQGGVVMPLRLSDLQGGDLARALRRRLPQLPENLLVLLSDDLFVSSEFLDEFGAGISAARLLRLAMPWAVDASSYGWLSCGTAVADPTHLYACLPHPGGGLRMLGVETVHGEVDLPSVLATTLALEHAWAPGRVEQRLSPGPLEWSRGLLFQKSRFEAFLA